MLSAADLLEPFHRAEREQAIMQAVVLMQGKRKKREAAELAAGHLVKITYYAPGHMQTDVYPARVAAFVCKVLGQAVGTSKGIRFVLFTQGRMSQSHYPADRAQLALLAMMSHARAEYKGFRRRFLAQLRWEVANQ